MPKPCKTCGRHGHSAAFCYQTKKKVSTTRKPINKVGKETRAWSEFRKHYLQLNPPNHEGYYECYICHKWVLANEITLDHVVARSSDPSLRYNQENIRLCCYECNTRKGSQSIDRFLQKKSKKLFTYATACGSISSRKAIRKVFSTRTSDGIKIAPSHLH